MLYFIILYYIISHYTILYYIIYIFIILYHIIIYFFIISYYIISIYIILYYIISCSAFTSFHGPLKRSDPMAKIQGPWNGHRFQVRSVWESWVQQPGVQAARKDGDVGFDPPDLRDPGELYDTHRIS